MFRELQYQQWLYDIFKERTWYKNLIGLYTKKKLVLLVENIGKEEAKKNFGRLTLDFTKSVVNLQGNEDFTKRYYILQGSTAMTNSDLQYRN